jgi:2'-5' RNA ligase
MLYALVHYPAVELRSINQLRSKYDPQFHLHEEIYTGLMSEYRKEVRPFIPHLTLGVFTGKNEEYAKALKEAERLNLDYECMLDRLHLIKINNERSQIVWSKEFLSK